MSHSEEPGALQALARVAGEQSDSDEPVAMQQRGQYQNYVCI